MRTGNDRSTLLAGDILLVLYTLLLVSTRAGILDAKPLSFTENNNEKKEHIISENELPRDNILSDHMLEILKSDEIVFTASKKPELLRTAPNAMSVVTLRQMNSLDNMYIQQALRLLPGIDVVQLSRTEFTVGLRGLINRSNFRPRDVLVLVDGRTIYDDFSGNVEWEILDIFPQDVAKIEVIRGAGSAIHGSNGTRGVLNILTRPPIGLPTFQTNSTFMADGFRQSLLGSGSDGFSSWKISGGYDNIELWNKFESETPQDITGADTWRLNSLFTQRLKNGAEISLSGGINRGTLLQHTTSGFLIENDRSNHHIMISYEAPKLAVRTFWNAQKLEGIGPNSRRVIVKRTQDLFDFEVVERLNMSSVNTMTLGQQFRFTSGDSTSIGGEKSQITGGVFLDDKHHWSPNTLIQFATRLDYHEEAKFHLSPRVSVSHKISEIHTIKASYNIGFRNPTFSNNYFSVNFGSTASITGNTDLKPEESRWTELGYIGKYGPRITAGLDLFHVFLKDTISPIEETASNPLGEELSTEIRFTFTATW